MIHLKEHPGQREFLSRKLQPFLNQKLEKGRKRPKLMTRGGQNQPQTDSYDRFTTESTIGIMSVVTTIGQFSVVNLW